ncbi:hypothetical protein [Streptomyces sp. SBT349]|uniref:hypothetical protein n=1 Tax=Streptomyces sp. SBT349 TaxID=1580539 RepID=UPI000A9A0DBC|nr:hypothetical protein [Streptomyces sp. SBT349]
MSDARGHARPRPAGFEAGRSGRAGRLRHRRREAALRAAFPDGPERVLADLTQADDRHDIAAARHNQPPVAPAPAGR